MAGDHTPLLPALPTLAHLLNGEVRNGEVACPGPNHSRKDRSLTVKPDRDAPDGFVLHSFAGDDPIVCRDYVRQKIGLPAFAPKRRRRSADEIARAVTTAMQRDGGKADGQPVAIYDYTDGGGTVLYQKLRYEPKQFRQRRPDGNGGWVWGLDDRRVLYRLPELKQYPDASIFVCEGEKDADRVAALGHCATTADEWTAECVAALKGRDVLILEDNDAAGRDKALAAAKALHGTAKTIRIVALPGLPDKGDVSDWLDADPRRAERLVAICFDVAEWSPDQIDNRTFENAKAETPTKPADDAPLVFVDIGAWLEREPPPRDWAVLNRFPLRNVSLLSGEGSVGKSILLMQLAAAHVLGKSWLDTLPEPGDAIYLNAEDEEAVLHRRFIAIAKFHDAPLSLLHGGLHLLALAGQDAVLGHVERGIVTPTALFGRLLEAAHDIKPKLIALDTSADIFAGAENDRAQVRQFIGLLRRLAIVGNCAVIVCAHPSLTGINTGTGLSGSTAWHNSVRARAYLHTITVDDDIEPDTALRQLDFMKSNYSAIASSVTLRWRDGVYVMEPRPGSLEKMAADAKADDAFMTRLRIFTHQGRDVSDAPTSTRYAPTLFAGDGCNRKQLEDAMHRLFAANRIRVEDRGKPSRPARQIVPC